MSDSDGQLLRRTTCPHCWHSFPPEDVLAEHLEESVSSTHCPWKGDASY